MAVYRCIAPAVIPLLLLLPVRASVRPARSEILDDKTDRMVDALPVAGFPFPTTLYHRGDVYVIVNVGAAYANVTVLAPPRVTPRQTADVLDSAVLESGWRAGDVRYASERDYSVATVGQSAARMGLRDSRIEVPIGPLIAGLRSAGWRPHVIVRVSQVVEVANLPKPWRSGRRYRIYDVRGWPDNAVVRTRGSLPRWALAVTLLITFVVPGYLLLLTLGGVAIGLWPGIEPDRRRKLFLAVGNRPVLPVLLLYGCAAIGYIHSQSARLVADLWFGQPSAQDGTAGTILYSLVVGVMLLLVPLAAVEVRLFRRDKAQVRPKPVAPRAERASNRWTYAGCGVQFLGATSVVAITNGIFGWKPDGPYWIAVPLVLMFGVSLALLLVAYDIGRNTAVVNEELTARAAELAKRMGAVARDVRIDESTTGQGNANALMLPNGRIRVTRALVDSLEEKELEWVLAHEVAHSRRKHWRRRWWLILLLPMAFFPMLTGTIGDHIWSDAPWVPLAIFALPTSCFLLGWLVLNPRARQAEYDADRDALAATRDLASAESALRKMAENSSLPYVHDMDDLPTHPKLSKRLDALRKAATEMGIAEPMSASTDSNQEAKP